MGLDACVYCDCVEKGRLRIPPPQPLIIAEDGYPCPAVESSDPQVYEPYDAWLWQRPCPHDEFTLLHYRLGNMAAIGFFRSLVQIAYDDPHIAVPVIWDQVIYSGIHAGDYLGLEDVRRMLDEVSMLRGMSRRVFDTYVERYSGWWAKRVWPGRDALVRGDMGLWAEFLRKMQELGEAALKVGKPISF